MPKPRMPWEPEPPILCDVPTTNEVNTENPVQAEESKDEPLPKDDSTDD